jgi:hypothetical protein
LLERWGIPDHSHRHFLKDFVLHFMRYCRCFPSVPSR